MRRKEAIRYVCIFKNTLKVGVFKEKTRVCKFIGVSASTFLRNFKGGIYETDEFIVKYPDEFQEKSDRGDKYMRNLRK
jgi:hypothetical protein